jgi:xylulokinase
MRYLIGIDLGTTSAKCAIYEETGSVVAEATREMEIIYPRSGEAEQDAYSFYTYSCDLIKQCLQTAEIDAGGIAAIGIDSQMGGIMPIDRNFNPVTYFDTPLDNRSADENRYMHGKYGDLIVEYNGSISTFGNKILYWKKKSEWRDIHKFVQPSGFVAGKLAGLTGDDAFMDESFLCFSGLSNLARSEWSDELCNKLDVDQSKLPRIVESSAIIGELSRQAAEDTNLPTGIPICAGCGDQAAGFFGAGILTPGQMADVSGTACIFAANVDHFTYDARNKTVACMKSAYGDNYYLLSVVLGGKTHKWFVDEFFPDYRHAEDKSGGAVYDCLDEEAANVSPGSDGLIAIDYLQGRFFPPVPSVRGLFIGHTWAHTRQHFYRAILESIAYDHYITKEIIETLVPELDLQAVTAIGSGAQSRFWMQLKADVLQVPYRNLFRSDLATLGAAMLGGYSLGSFPDMAANMKEMVKTRERVEPTPGEEKKYLKYIEIYRELFATLKDVYLKLSSR